MWCLSMTVCGTHSLNDIYYYLCFTHRFPLCLIFTDLGSSPLWLFVELNRWRRVWSQCPCDIELRTQLGLEGLVDHLDSCCWSQRTLNKSIFLVRCKPLARIRKQFKCMWMRGIASVEETSLVTDFLLSFSAGWLLVKMQMSLREQNYALNFYMTEEFYALTFTECQ